MPFVYNSVRKSLYCATFFLKWHSAREFCLFQPPFDKSHVYQFWLSCFSSCSFYQNKCSLCIWNLESLTLNPVPRVLMTHLTVRPEIVSGKDWRVSRSDVAISTSFRNIFHSVLWVQLIKLSKLSRWNDDVFGMNTFLPI